MLRPGILMLLLAAPAAAQTAGSPGPLVHDPTDLRPEAPLPADAIVPGAPGITAIVCEADPAPIDASGAFGLSPAAAQKLATATPPRRVRVENPWTAAPVLSGAGDAMKVAFFKRGRTLIFDARSEVLYLDRDHRRFTYTRSAKEGVTTWHGLCRAEG